LIHVLQIHGCNCIRPFKISDAKKKETSFVRILKANLTWNPTWAKFCHLIASLFVVLSYLKPTQLEFEYLKFGFKCKKERYKHKRKFFCILELFFFESSSSFLLKYGRLSRFHSTACKRFYQTI